MGVNATDFESFEQQFLELLGEFQALTTSEARLRESVRTEATRAEAADSARAGAERAASEARSAAAAATSAATHAASALARAQDECTALKMQLELAERHRSVLEERCTELSLQLGSLEREVEELRPFQTAQSTLQRQYVELQDRVRKTTEETKKEMSRLESELRRVERCAGGGSEIRSRARMAAAAHARERRLAAEEFQHASRELQAANVEISRLKAHVAELQCRQIQSNNDLTSTKGAADLPIEALAEVRAALDAERAGNTRLERALAAALADNATLAAQLNAADNADRKNEDERVPSPPAVGKPANIDAIDSFLAD